MENVNRVDWDNNDQASPVLHFDLTMSDIRDGLIKALQTDNEKDRIIHLECLHEYVRGLIDGNRFFRNKPEMIHKLKGA